jgi:hypothetical protein
MSKKQIEKFEDTNTRYHFVGKGRGIVGLPHEITREEARSRGVEKLLEAAIANGNYMAMDAANGNSVPMDESLLPHTQNE